MTGETERPAVEAGSPSDLGPVRAAERIETVDVLRGLSLLGILVINIEFFGLPSGVYFDARIAGGLSGLDLLTWQFGSIFFLQKMMGIFSMLFGAGVVLMANRAAAAGRPSGGIYYRRILWLLLFGMIHGYLIWYGDILYSYAVIGLFLYLLRNRSPRALIVLGLAVMLLGSMLQWGTGRSLIQLEGAVSRLEAARQSGETLTGGQRALIEQWDEISATFAPGPEEVKKEVAAYRGGYLSNLSYRAPENFVMQTQAFFFFTLWRAAGMMILGMAFMKLGILSGQRSTRFYVGMMLLGYGAGLPLCLYSALGLIAHDFDFIHIFLVDNQLNYWGSLPVALAHVSLLVLIHRRGWLAWLTSRLVAVGRMAFSNYLLHSIICTTLFYGFGFGLFNRLGRFQLFTIVVAIWIFQLAVGPWWLERYRFGPAEWLWRSLTYGKMQPMRVAR